LSRSSRRPILVGAAAILQRESNPTQAHEPLELMAAALEAAAEDAGCPALLREADAISAPRGFWAYGDPCRLLAERFGCPKAHTTIAEIGVLQTTLFGDAATRIASGEVDVVLVTGAEAKHRSLRATIEGIEVPLTQNDGRADRVLEPHADIMHPLELAVEIAMPVRQYSVMENALRRAEGLSVDEHRREIARIWSEFSEVAADNPAAWRPDPVSADEIREPVGKNSMLAFPYTKLHNSQWNVDQAAGLIFCSEAAAERLGIDPSKWIYPLSVAESNHMVPLAERSDPERSYGARIAGSKALELAGLEASDIDHMEIYSCFPSAVRIQARELGIAADRPLSVTGGMAFGGGPLNNFVLQALARMVQVLREDPGSTGLVTAVSGILTKQGFSVWSSQDSERDFAYADVTDAVAAAFASESGTIEVVRGYAGSATLRAHTVLYESDEPAKVVALCDTSTGKRSLVTSVAPEALRRATEEEVGGAAVEIASGEFQFV